MRIFFRLLKAYQRILIGILCFTFLPLRHDSNSTPEPTPTPALMPARDRDLLPFFESLMLSNQGCDLPCWWGFVQGQTTLSEVSRFLRDTGFDRAWRESGLPFSLERYLQLGENINFDFADNQEGYYFTDTWMTLLFSEDNRLMTLAITFARPEIFQSQVQDKILLPGFLQQLPGVPEIYVDATYIFSGELLIIDREQGISANYQFDLDRADDFSSATLCATIEKTRYFTFTIHAIRSDFPNPLAFTPIDNLYDVDAATLVEFFRDHPQECLEINYQPSSR